MHASLAVIALATFAWPSASLADANPLQFSRNYLSHLELIDGPAWTQAWHTFWGTTDARKGKDKALITNAQSVLHVSAPNLATPRLVPLVQDEAPALQRSGNTLYDVLGHSSSLAILNHTVSYVPNFKEAISKDDQDEQWTFLAPTNEAFVRIGRFLRHHPPPDKCPSEVMVWGSDAARGFEALSTCTIDRDGDGDDHPKLPPTHVLETILRYHVIKGRISEKSRTYPPSPTWLHPRQASVHDLALPAVLSDVGDDHPWGLGRRHALIASNLTVDSLGDAPQQIRITSAAKGLEICLNYFAQIVYADVGASNGVLHAIDGPIVVPPRAGHLIEVLSKSHGKIFHLFLKYLDLLEKHHPSILNRDYLDECEAYTLFVPTNHAFTSLGRRRLHWLTHTEEGRKLLAKIIMGHVVPRLAYSDELYDGTKDGKQMTLDTVADNQINITALRAKGRMDGWPDDSLSSHYNGVLISQIREQMATVREGLQSGLPAAYTQSETKQVDAAGKHHHHKPGHGKHHHHKPGHGKHHHHKPGHGKHHHHKPGHGKPGHGKPHHPPHGEEHPGIRCNGALGMGSRLLLNEHVPIIFEDMLARNANLYIVPRLILPEDHYDALTRMVDAHSHQQAAAAPIQGDSLTVEDVEQMLADL